MGPGATKARARCEMDCPPPAGNNWRAIHPAAVAPAQPRVRRRCRDLDADFVVRSAACGGMDSAGCRLNCSNCHLALMAARARPACNLAATTSPAEPAHSGCPVLVLPAQADSGAAVNCSFHFHY